MQVPVEPACAEREIGQQIYIPIITGYRQEQLSALHLKQYVVEPFFEFFQNAICLVGGGIELIEQLGEPESHHGEHLMRGFVLVLGAPCVPQAVYIILRRADILFIAPVDIKRYRRLVGNTYSYVQFIIHRAT